MTLRKKILHLFKTEPDETQQTLIRILSMEQECREIRLYQLEEEVDYEEVIDLIFDYDKVITWW